MISTREKIKQLIDNISKLCSSNETINIMEVCGTHTHVIGKSGLRQLLPGNIKLLSGPGCPVCVTHERDIEAYLDMSRRDNIIIATFGDLLRVPSSKGSLIDAREEGARVQVVYSPLEAVNLAGANPDKEVIFLGIGFETTAPAVAMSIITAKKQGIKNYSVFPMHKLVKPALEALLEDNQVRIDGFILPGHVSTIIGVEPYRFLVRRYNRGGVITGFEPLDIVEALYMMVKQVVSGAPDIENQYVRGVPFDGNPVAREATAMVFEPEDAWWRGLGLLPGSGLKIKDEFAGFDAKNKFNIKMPATSNLADSGCVCGDILKGIKTPDQCLFFGGACTPSSPVGPCMVSSEGTCAAYHHYERYREG